MTDPMANPPHACDVADRVEQLTPIDADFDLLTSDGADIGRVGRVSLSPGKRPDEVEDEASPQALLAYAASSLDEPVSVADIDEAFGITADRLFTIVLEHLDGHPLTAVDSDLVAKVEHRAHHYLWMHRC